MEDDLNGRRPQWKTTTIEEDLNERGLTSKEDKLKGTQPQGINNFIEE